MIRFFFVFTKQHEHRRVTLWDRSFVSSPVAPWDFSPSLSQTHTTLNLIHFVDAFFMLAFSRHILCRIFVFSPSL